MSRTFQIGKAALVIMEDRLSVCPKKAGHTDSLSIIRDVVLNELYVPTERPGSDFSKLLINQYFIDTS